MVASNSLSALLSGRTLRVGDEGPVVRTLQLALAKLGYALRGSGYFAGATLAAVKDFQKKHRLEMDGEVEAETAVAIDRAVAKLRSKKRAFELSAIAALIGGRILRSGDEGPIVQTIQLALARLGYPSKGTGTFGPLTVRAVKDFQTPSQSRLVDGEMGPETAVGVDRALAAIPHA